MRTILLLLLLSCSVLAKAGTTPDSLAVSKLYGSSWVLTGKYRLVGIFHRKQKIENPAEMMITIYKDEIHTSLTTGKYQVCASRHRNKNEFWLDCAQPDQYIYRVISISANELVIDVMSRPKGSTDYVRASRNYYRKKT